MTVADNALEIPPDVLDASDGAEVLRAWIADQQLHVILKPTIWRDGREWGILLADIAQHVADALEAEFGKDFQKTVDRIRMTFNTELSAPTSEREGSFTREGGG